MRRRFFAGIRLVCGAAFFALALHGAVEVRERECLVTAQMDVPLQDTSAAQGILEIEAEEEEPQSVCFWGEEPEITLTCRETGKSGTATLLLYAGSPELLEPSASVLSLQENGCLLDKSTSVNLFGTEAARGQYVWCGEKSWLVAETFDSLRPMMIRRAASGDGKVLDSVSLRTETGEGKAGMEQFLLRCGMSGEVMDFAFLSAVVCDLLWLVPALLLVRLVFRLIGGFSEEAILFAALLTASASMLLWRCGIRFQIPGDMIPSRWSDFSFWSTWWDGQKKNLLLVLAGAQGEARLELLWNAAQSLTGSAGALVLTATMRDGGRERK